MGIGRTFRQKTNRVEITMDDKTQRILLELEEQLAGAVMSKFVSQPECTAYRGALIDAMERIRRLSAAERESPK
jgi:hypothetical protein